MWLFPGLFKTSWLIKKQANRNPHSKNSEPLTVCTFTSLSAVKVWAVVECLKQLGKQIREGGVES